MSYLCMKKSNISRNNFVTLFDKFILIRFQFDISRYGFASKDIKFWFQITLRFYQVKYVYIIISNNQSSFVC